MNTFIIDIDFTLIFTPFVNGKYEYDKSIPYISMIKKVNMLYDKGNSIILFTARGMGSRNFNIELIEKECRPIVIEQLRKFGVKYNELIMGKPWGKGNLYYIDDKNLTINQFLEYSEDKYPSIIKQNSAELLKYE